MMSIYKIVSRRRLQRGLKAELDGSLKEFYSSGSIPPEAQKDIQSTIDSIIKWCDQTCARPISLAMEASGTPLSRKSRLKSVYSFEFRRATPNGCADYNVQVEAFNSKIVSFYAGLNAIFSQLSIFNKKDPAEKLLEVNEVLKSINETIQRIFSEFNLVKAYFDKDMEQIKVNAQNRSLIRILENALTTLSGDIGKNIKKISGAKISLIIKNRVVLIEGKKHEIADCFAQLIQSKKEALRSFLSLSEGPSLTTEDRKAVLGTAVVSQEMKKFVLQLNEVDLVVQELIKVQVSFVDDVQSMDMLLGKLKDAFGSFFSKQKSTQLHDEEDVTKAINDALNSTNGAAKKKVSQAQKLTETVSQSIANLRASLNERQKLFVEIQEMDANPLIKILLLFDFFCKNFRSLTKVVLPIEEMLYNTLPRIKPDQISFVDAIVTQIGGGDLSPSSPKSIRDMLIRPVQVQPRLELLLLNIAKPLRLMIPREDETLFPIHQHLLLIASYIQDNIKEVNSQL